MKYLFLLLILAGCAAPKAIQSKEDNSGDTKIEIQTPWGHGEANSTAVEVIQIEKPWKKLGEYIGTANTVEELFNKEELNKFLIVSKGNQENRKVDTPTNIIIPPLWHRIRYINTNIKPFKKDFWNDPIWYSNYLEVTKDYPKKLSPQEATEALYSRDITIYTLYYFGEMGANFNHTNSYEEDIKREAINGYNLKPNGPKYMIYSYLNSKDGDDDIPIYEYLFDRGFSVSFFYSYRRTWFSPGTELLKYLVSKGLDLNNIPNGWCETREPHGKREDMLYMDSFIYKDPFYAHLLIALGYTNEVAGFQITSFVDEVQF